MLSITDPNICDKNRCNSSYLLQVVNDQARNVILRNLTDLLQPVLNDEQYYAYETAFSGRDGRLGSRSAE